MAMQAPTRITIEVHPPEPGSGWEPFVRVVPEATPARSTPPAMTAVAREDAPTPAAYEPGPCLCLDDADCGADHANE